MESVPNLLVPMCATVALTSGRVVNFCVLKLLKSGALISKYPKPLAVGIYERCRRELNYLTDKERRKL